jgi:hypothetical protein
MANASFPTLSAVVTGNAGSLALVSASAGQSARLWALLIGATTNDSTAQFSYTAAGTSVTIKVPVALGTTVLPMSGVPYAIADVNTAITFVAAAGTTFNAFYTKGQGG